MKSTGDVHRSEGILQLILCCSSTDETVELSLSQLREKKESVGNLPGLLYSVACGLAGGICWH